MNQNLFKLFNFCGKNNIDFIYETEESGKNQITHIIDKNQRVISIKIVDPEDENLNELIEKELIQLSSIIL